MAAAELTHREQEILALIADGCSSKEIACRLGGSTLTIETHVMRSRLKLGARTRAEAVAIWQRRQQKAAARIVDDVEYPKSSTENQVPNFGDYPDAHHQE